MVCSSKVQLKLTIIIVLCFFILLTIVYIKYDNKELVDICMLDTISEKEHTAPITVHTKKENIKIKEADLADLELLILSIDYENKIPKEKSKDKISNNLKKNIDKLVDIGMYIKNTDKSNIKDIISFNKKIDEYKLLYSVFLNILNSYHITNPHLISIKINNTN